MTHESGSRRRISDHAPPTLMRTYYVYILASPSGVLYTGMTNNAQRRIVEHRLKLVAGFTKKYNVTKLVYFEVFGQIRSAIAREK
jgi:putative endonuclease